eukprot:XP_024997459.1 transmembrane protein 100 isoform X1 [Gallus gallus]
MALWHSTVRHVIAGHSTAQHGTARRAIAQHGTAQHAVAQHGAVRLAAQRRTPLAARGAPVRLRRIPAPRGAVCAGTSGTEPPLEAFGAPQEELLPCRTVPYRGRAAFRGDRRDARCVCGVLPMCAKVLRLAESKVCVREGSAAPPRAPATPERRSGPAVISPTSLETSMLERCHLWFIIQRHLTPQSLARSSHCPALPGSGTSGTGGTSSSHPPLAECAAMDFSWPRAMRVEQCLL